MSLYTFSLLEWKRRSFRSIDSDEALNGVVNAETCNPRGLTYAHDRWKCAEACTVYHEHLFNTLHTFMNQSIYTHGRGIRLIRISTSPKLTRLGKSVSRWERYGFQGSNRVIKLLHLKRETSAKC